MSVARGSGTTHNTDKAGARQTGSGLAIEGGGGQGAGGGGALRELGDWGTSERDGDGMGGAGHRDKREAEFAG